VSFNPLVQCQVAIGRVYSLQLDQHCRPRLFVGRHPPPLLRRGSLHVASLPLQRGYHSTPVETRAAGKRCVAPITTIKPAESVFLPYVIGGEAKTGKRHPCSSSHLTCWQNNTLPKILMRNAPYLRAFCFVGVSHFCLSSAVPSMLQFLFGVVDPSKGIGMQQVEVAPSTVHTSVRLC